MTWLLHVAASAAVRKVVYLLIGALVAIAATAVGR